MKFEITKTDIFPIKPQAGLCAFASITINDAIQLGSIGVRIGEQGKVSITIPAKKVGASMKFYFQVSTEVKELMVEAVQKAIDTSGMFGFNKA